MAWTQQLIAFWFGLDPERHWRVDPALDATIAGRFRALWEREQEQPADAFLGDAETALAAILLFDQFPRNMFRDDGRAFATDPLARAVADGGIARGFDREIAADRRHFFYLPFEHSEELADQERSLDLFAALGNDRYLDFARKHHGVIARFGRFPHRNEMLGRASTAAELALGPDAPW